MSEVRLIPPRGIVCVECANCGFAGAYETPLGVNIESIGCPCCGRHEMRRQIGESDADQVSGEAVI